MILGQHPVCIDYLQSTLYPVSKLETSAVESGDLAMIGR
jgi:hypothetical protein